MVYGGMFGDVIVSFGNGLSEAKPSMVVWG